MPRPQRGLRAVLTIALAAKKAARQISGDGNGSWAYQKKMCCAKVSKNQHKKARSGRLGQSGRLKHIGQAHKSGGPTGAPVRGLAKMAREPAFDVGHGVAGFLL